MSSLKSFTRTRSNDTAGALSFLPVQGWDGLSSTRKWINRFTVAKERDVPLHRWHERPEPAKSRSYGLCPLNQATFAVAIATSRNRKAPL